MAFKSAANKLLGRAAESFDELRHRPRGQVPALDALRTCAVLMVVWGHTSESYQDAGGAGSVLSGIRILGSGWIGVNLFFVLSGYLIGKQLWREWQQEGTIDFWRFFLRRGFRIWPLYFFFLAFVTLALGRGDFFGDHGWSDAIFLTNYLNHGVVVGSWSLCTEEQFYLIAPLALIAFAPFIRSLVGYRRCLWLAVLALPAVRAVSWWRLTGDLSRHDPVLWNQYLYQPIHSNCDGLLMGLILSNLMAERRRPPARWSWPVALSLLGASCVAAVCLRLVQREVFNLTGMTLILGSVVLIAVNAQQALPPLLSARVFYLLSRLSYGIYLNHAYLHRPVADFALSYLPGGRTAPSAHLFAVECLVIVASSVFAALTFCLIEHPFLRLREVLLEGTAARRAATEIAAPADEGARLQPSIQGAESPIT